MTVYKSFPYGAMPSTLEFDPYEKWVNLPEVDDIALCGSWLGECPAGSHCTLSVCRPQSANIRYTFQGHLTVFSRTTFVRKDALP